jgi:hypothetical protein
MVGPWAGLPVSYQVTGAGPEASCPLRFHIVNPDTCPGGRSVSAAMKNHDK